MGRHFFYNNSKSKKTYHAFQWVFTNNSQRIAQLPHFSSTMRPQTMDGLIHWPVFNTPQSKDIGIFAVLFKFSYSLSRHLSRGICHLTNDRMLDIIWSDALNSDGVAVGNNLRTWGLNFWEKNFLAVGPLSLVPPVCRGRKFITHNSTWSRYDLCWAMIKVLRSISLQSIYVCISVESNPDTYNELQTPPNPCHNLSVGLLNLEVKLRTLLCL